MARALAAPVRRRLRAAGAAEVMIAWASPTAPPLASVSAIRRHHAPSASSRAIRSRATRPEPSSHGDHTPTTATAMPATGHPVAAHTATPAPIQPVMRHRSLAVSG